MKKRLENARLKDRKRARKEKAKDARLKEASRRDIIKDNKNGREQF